MPPYSGSIGDAEPALLGDQPGQPDQCGAGALHLGYQRPYHTLGELAYALP